MCLALSFITWFSKQLFTLRSAVREGFTHTHTPQWCIHAIIRHLRFLFDFICKINKSVEHQTWSWDSKMIDLILAGQHSWVDVNRCMSFWVGPVAVQLKPQCCSRSLTNEPSCSQSARYLVSRDDDEQGSSCLGVSLMRLVLSALQGDNNKLWLANWLMEDE